MALADFMTPEEFAIYCKDHGHILLEKKDDLATVATPGVNHFTVGLYEKTGNRWMLDCIYSIDKAHIKILSAFLNDESKNCDAHSISALENERWHI